MSFTFCYIKEKYFVRNQHFIKMLDMGNTAKQANRGHLCISTYVNGNTFYIPLRNNLGADIRKFGRIGHSVPSQSRPNAGLDYRYALIVNDKTDLEIPKLNKIPNSQIKIMRNNYSIISSEFSVYLKGFIKAAKKNRIQNEPLYRESSLINFLSELGINN